jgi:hypothetical protein
MPHFYYFWTTNGAGAHHKNYCPMKKIILSFALLTIFSSTQAQPGGENLEPTCYQKYAAVFEKRGAHAVEDGTYEDVVVSVRYGNTAECLLGKVTVIGGKMGDISIKFEDGTFTPLKKKYKHNVPITITNGISTPQVTVDDEIVSVLFVMNIKPKPKAFAKAPEPDFK